MIQICLRLVCLVGSAILIRPATPFLELAVISAMLIRPALWVTPMRSLAAVVLAVLMITNLVVPMITNLVVPMIINLVVLMIISLV